MKTLLALLTAIIMAVGNLSQFDFTKSRVSTSVEVEAKRGPVRTEFEPTPTPSFPPCPTPVTPAPPTPIADPPEYFGYH